MDGRRGRGGRCRPPPDAARDRALPRRGRVVLLGPNRPDAATFRRPSRWAPQHVIALPGHDSELMAELSDAADAISDAGRRGAVRRRDRGPGRGRRVGFRDRAGAVVAARRAADRRRPVGRGHRPAARQRGRAPACAGPISRCRAVGSATRRCATRCRNGAASRVLSGSRTGGDIDAAPLGAVVDAGSRGGATVVCDLPRRSTGAVEIGARRGRPRRRDRPADVRSCAAAAAIAPWLSAVNPNVGLVVRGPSPGGLQVGRRRRDRRAAAAGRDAARSRAGRCARARRAATAAVDHRWRAAARRVLAVLHQHQRRRRHERVADRPGPRTAGRRVGRRCGPTWSPRPSAPSPVACSATPRC